MLACVTTRNGGQQRGAERQQKGGQDVLELFGVWSSPNGCGISPFMSRVPDRYRQLWGALGLSVHSGAV